MRGTAANGERLQVAREMRGLTKERLALLAGLDVKTVRKAEQGKRMDFVSLSRLADVLQIELREIFPTDERESGGQPTLADRVGSWNRAWDARDIEGILAHYHEEAVLHLPGGPGIPFGGEHRGKEAIRQANLSAWANCQTEPSRPGDLSVIVSDDTAILRAMKGVYLPDGSVVRLWCIQAFTFRGDRIIEHHVEYDTLRFCQLLNLAEPGPPPEKPPEVP